MGSLIVTDSSACVRPSVARRHAIRIVPIGLLFADGREEIDGSPALVRKELARQLPVKSAPPSVLDYLAAIDDCDADHVLVLTPAVEFTVMYRAARLAADLAERPVHVIDTRTAAAAQGLVVLEAAQAARAGAPPEVVVAAAEHAVRSARLLAAVDSLDAVEQDGLVPSASLMAARRAGMRPVFCFQDGNVEPVADVGEADLVGFLTEEWRARSGSTSRRAVVFHAGAPAAARSLRATLGVSEPLAAFSAAMAVHTGLGVVGVAWLA